jgi:protein-disulfide isomerase
MHEDGRANGGRANGGFRSVGGLSQKLTAGLARKGAGGGRVASITRLRGDWAVIVGTDLARCTEPDALTAGRGGKAGAKLLRLKVAGAMALEVQHMSGQIVERVNAYFGHRQIDDIRLVQGTIARKVAAPPIPKPAPEVLARMDAKVSAVSDPDLRAALARLGARIVTKGGTGRRAVLLGALGSLFLARGVRAQASDAEKYLGEVAGDHVLGDPNAPNVIIDYFSLTCPHCANFNAAVMPVVRKEWVETGKAKLIMRHFPSDGIATHAALFAECAGSGKFYDVVDALFKAQIDWLTASDTDAEMIKVLVRQGISAAAATACLSDDQHLNKIIADVQSGQALQVRSTPSLFINEHFYGMPGDGAAGISAILRQVGR